MERLRQLRKAKNMSQVRLGIEIGAAQETISGYEIGKAVPPADMLVKLADTLGTSVDYILGRTNIKAFEPFCRSDLSDAELELITAFRKIPETKRQWALGLFLGLAE